MCSFLPAGTDTSISVQILSFLFLIYYIIIIIIIIIIQV
jgi:hypothetical protein